MDNVAEEKLATETDLAAPVSVVPKAPIHRLASNRMANKQRKKRAHHRKLRRSHTKG